MREDAGRVVGAVEVRRSPCRPRRGRRCRGSGHRRRSRFGSSRRRRQPQLARVAAAQRLEPLLDAVDLNTSRPGRLLGLDGCRRRRASTVRPGRRLEAASRATPDRPASGRCRRSAPAPADCGVPGADPERPPRSMRQSRSAPSSSIVGSPSRSLVSARPLAELAVVRNAPRPAHASLTVMSRLRRPARQDDVGVGADPTRFRRLQPAEARPGSASRSRPEAPIALHSPGLDSARCASSAWAVTAAAGRSGRRRAGPIRTYVAGPPSTGFALMRRPDVAVPSSATAIGPSPNLARGRRPRSPRRSARPARARRDRASASGSGRRARRLLAGVVPGVAEGRGEVGLGPVEVDGGEDEAARRLGPVVDRHGEEAEARIVRRGHVEPLRGGRSDAPAA